MVIWMVFWLSIHFFADGFLTRMPRMAAMRRSTSLQVMPMVPHFPNKNAKEYMWLDIYNALGRERKLFVSRYLDDEAANQLIASLVYLSESSPSEAITLYLNIPGAQVRPVLAVYDIIARLTCPLVTINAGLTVGPACLLAAAGTPGQRHVFPNARFLVGKGGLEDGLPGLQLSSAVAMQVEAVLAGNVRWTEHMARLCRQPLSNITADLRRDFYLTAPEARGYGLVDSVLIPESIVKFQKHRGPEDNLVTYGHFAEVDKLYWPEKKPVEVEEPEDVPQAKQGKKEENRLGGREAEMAKSRLKPAGWNKPKAKVEDKGIPKGFG